MLKRALGIASINGRDELGPDSSDPTVPSIFLPFCRIFVTAIMWFLEAFIGSLEICGGELVSRSILALWNWCVLEKMQTPMVKRAIGRKFGFLRISSKPLTAECCMVGQQFNEARGQIKCACRFWRWSKNLCFSLPGDVYFEAKSKLVLKEGFGFSSEPKTAVIEVLIGNNCNCLGAFREKKEMKMGFFFFWGRGKK